MNDIISIIISINPKFELNVIHTYLLYSTILDSIIKYETEQLILSTFCSMIDFRVLGMDYLGSARNFQNRWKNGRRSQQVRLPS